MINSFRSERGWWDRRRIVVLVSVVSVFGVISLSSAGTALAVIPASCNASLTPKSKSNPGPAGKLSFVCDGPIRAYGLASNKTIKDYAPGPGGGLNAFMSCEGTGFGFGCGVVNRATPGFQDPGTTGWKAQPVPPFPSSSTVPTTCGGFRRVATSPNRDAVVKPPCDQVIPAGAPITQNVTLGFNPCKTNTSNPPKLFLFVGGEPLTVSFTAAGDTVSVGESISPPYPVKLKGYQGCESTGGGGKKGAKSTAAATNNFPISCAGTVEPAVAGQKNHDAKFIFKCSQNIRAFGIYSNRQIDLGAEEPTVVGIFGGRQTESALHQCEGFYPGPGFGCGITNRQAQDATLPNGQGITAGNFAEARFGFVTAPCNGKGLPKPKVWVVAMGEPVIGGVVGEYISAPQQIPVTGYGKCKEDKKKQ